jgi:hypothetical protein
MNLIIPQLVGIANIRADNKESTDAHKETGRCSLLPVNAHFLLQQTYGRKTTTVLTWQEETGVGLAKQLAEVSQLVYEVKVLWLQNQWPWSLRFTAPTFILWPFWNLCRWLWPSLWPHVLCDVALRPFCRTRCIVGLLDIGTSRGYGVRHGSGQMGCPD